MQVKIVSDGTAHGTKVVDAFSGEAIQGVQLINFMATADGDAEALLHLVGIQCEIVCGANMQLVPDLSPYIAEDLDED